MKKFVVGSLLAVVVAGGSAIAADLPYRAPAAVYKAPPPQIFSWTGCYVGGHVGWMKNDSDLSAYSGPGFGPAFLAATTYGYNFNNSDVTAGVQYGCNKQVGQWVFGLDSSLSWSGLSESVFAAHPATPGVVAYNETLTQELNWYSTTRGRIGYAWDRWMVFAAGGLATGRVESTYFSPPAGGFSYAGSETKTRYGWTLGGGVEYALSQNWFLRGEYLYVDLGKYSYISAQTPASPVFNWVTEVDTKFHVARVALSYRFTTQPSLFHWASSGFRY